MTAPAAEPCALRPALPGDAAALAAILNAEIAGGTASWKTDPVSAEAMADWHLSRLTGGFPVLVAAEPDTHGVIRGFASYGPFRSGGAYAGTVEHSVYVAAPARRQGIGGGLLAALIADARGRGLSRMVGAISADQEGSLALHARFGFADCGRLPGVGAKFGRRLDLVLMVLALD